MGLNEPWDVHDIETLILGGQNQWIWYINLQVVNNNHRLTVHLILLGKNLFIVVKKLFDGNIMITQPYSAGNTALASSLCHFLFFTKP